MVVLLVLLVLPRSLVLPVWKAKVAMLAYVVVLLMLELVVIFTYPVVPVYMVSVVQSSLALKFLNPIQALLISELVLLRMVLVAICSL